MTSHSGSSRLYSQDDESLDPYEYIKVEPTTYESMNFEEVESLMWRKHQLRRFFQDKGHWWTNSKKSTAWKWTLVIILGIVVGVLGYIVSITTDILTSAKFNTSLNFIREDKWAQSFFSFIGFCWFYALLAGILCWLEPAAAGSGIPEIKAYLNGINLSKSVRLRVLFAKIAGVCFSVAAGLPLGKEGPMIHAGAVVGKAVSQGKHLTLGFDTSWSTFQDLRTDGSKRDFVTFGAAAGVAAAFSAPIGGILFTLEEGASYWSTTLTVRAFICALMTQLTLNLLYSGFESGLSSTEGLFAFGQFDDDDFTDYRTYELLIFAGMGVVGGLMGAYFNHVNKWITIYRMHNMTTKSKRMLELLVLTFIMAIISFIMPLMWNVCNDIPSESDDWTDQEDDLLDELVHFQCHNTEYNQVASLYFTSADIAMQQLYHFREVDGTSYTTFNTIPLLMFAIPYFLMAILIPGVFCPAGLFVPSLVAGAAFGRVVGHVLNVIAAGYVASSGTYALIGAAALLGGVTRMTIAGTVILLEASGNSEFLLPLMLTFAAARYTGNAINSSMYDLQIRLKRLPFLEGSLRTLGLLNSHPVVEIMAQPVVTLPIKANVGAIYDMLSSKTHNGFPIVSKNGRLKGIILRKTLCTLMKLKVFSTPTADDDEEGSTKSAPTATVFYDTLERSYPHYPKIEEIHLSPLDRECVLDLKPYMDTSPYTIHASSSIQRCYRFFRTMGLRHLIVVDGDLQPIGIITRKDLSEHRLEDYWNNEGENMQKYISLDPLDPAYGEFSGNSRYSSDSGSAFNRGGHAWVSKKPASTGSPLHAPLLSIDEESKGPSTGGSSGLMNSPIQEDELLETSGTERKKEAKKEVSKEPKSIKTFHI